MEHKIMIIIAKLISNTIGIYNHTNKCKRQAALLHNPAHNKSANESIHLRVGVLNQLEKTMINYQMIILLAQKNDKTKNTRNTKHSKVNQTRKTTGDSQ